MKQPRRRWPFGYPSTFYVGRKMGFYQPGGFERVASSMTKANKRFAYLGLSPPKFGASSG